MAKHWARDVPQRPPVQEVFAQLVASVWRGELDVVGSPGRPEVRRHLLEALVRLCDHPGVAIFPDAASVPDPITPQADGGALVDTRTFVFLPRDLASWDAKVAEAACAALALVDPETYSLEFRTVLRMRTISRVEFERYCLTKGFPLPPFWFGPRRRRTATAKAKSDCRRWLKELVAAEEKPAPKAMLWREAKTKFPHLSERAFEEVWDELVPPHWRAAGAPKGPRHAGDRRATRDR